MKIFSLHTWNYWNICAINLRHLPELTLLPLLELSFHFFILSWTILQNTFHLQLLFWITKLASHIDILSWLPVQLCVTKKIWAHFFHYYLWILVPQTDSKGKCHVNVCFLLSLLSHVKWHHELIQILYTGFLIV